VLYAPFDHLLVHGREDFLLRLLNLVRDLLATTNNVQRRPGQERGHGTEVRTVRFAAQSCCLKWNRAGAAERITHPWSMAKPPPAQFFHQFRQARCMSTHMSVDLLPRLGRRASDLLRPAAVLQLF